MIIGIVKECQKSTISADNKTRNADVVNFTLEGADGFCIYLCAWEENAARVVSLAKQDNVIFLEGVCAKSNSSQFTSDGRNFFLTVRSNARVYLLENNNQDIEADDVEQKPTVYNSIKEVLDGAKHNDLICIDLYLSRNFRYQNKFNSFGITVVRDKYHSLNLTVTSYIETADKPSLYKIGDKLRITANLIIEESGWISLNGNYRKIEKLDEDAAIYRALSRAVSPERLVSCF